MKSYILSVEGADDDDCNIFDGEDENSYWGVSGAAVNGERNVVSKVSKVEHRRRFT